ncbi:MAG: hypothetical protein UT30_C0001G0052 [Candidatus Uhrbacteria bacterium GW2011_GWF2_39_13]|uniref:Lipoprotein n=1 Tax=Candidatus Uhrbacteria bacterium GW2011_GWF2_39_13 TaxID=1618995 RepID=A0A0G0MPR8_9BACT|nr:MAG: hypothetical protein UT30_C0001G0052 [Candidatus Uhrbacteria bacterium GW2011_GWF2_39_13]HAU66378.1 hypothetical protein [Candidatus Uhrbacteria bacterium]
MKSSTFLPILGITALMLLLGAGCVAPSVQTQQTARTDEELIIVKEEPFLEEEPETNNDGGRMAAPEACEEGHLRYSNDTLGFTFCYSPMMFTNGGYTSEILLKENEETLILYPKDLPDFQHTITRLRFDETLNPKEAIETLYMKDADKSVCTVVEINKTSEYTEYLLVGGDLENQEKCGTYKVGSLRAYENTPGSLFYITIGQDTFMADDVWLKTLEPRAQDPNN